MTRQDAEKAMLKLARGEAFNMLHKLATLFLVPITFWVANEVRAFWTLQNEIRHALGDISEISERVAQNRALIDRRYEDRFTNIQGEALGDEVDDLRDMVMRHCLGREAE